MVNETPSQNTEQDQSGMGWYIAGAVLILLGLVGGTGTIVYGVMDVMNTGDQLHRFRIPGTHELQLKKKGTYTVYHEYSSQLDGEVFRTSGNDLNKYKFTLHPKNEPDRDIPLEADSSSSTYEFGSRKGRSLFTFRVDEPGKYVFQTRPKPDKKKEEITECVLTVGQNLILNLFKNIGIILGGGCCFLVLVGGGLAIILIRFFS